MRLRAGVRWYCLTLSLLVCASAAGAPPTVRIGSKAFTESVILGEIAAQVIRHAGVGAIHKSQLGGTRTLWNALLAGDIDVYPEYTGTLAQEILNGARSDSIATLRAGLRRRGVYMSAPLGFNNTYAIGMRRARARQLGVRDISDLARHPALRFGFSNEFMARADGWPGLAARYGLPQRDVRGLDHDLAYRGLVSGDIDVTDLYATDAEIRYYDLAVLQDDRGYFPAYEAIWLYRPPIMWHAPAALRGLKRLQGTISRARMADMNAQAKLQGVSVAEVAAGFVTTEFGFAPRVERRSPFAELMRYTREHLLLVLGSLSAAVAVAIPLGVMAARAPHLGQVVLAATGIIQTIPALALLVFMIPWLGIGGPPAIFALFLYSLLPIVRNTYTGLRDIPLEIKESAEALGLPAISRLRLVELPMATPSILAGIKTSAVINIGTATLGALVGAGGYGQPILTGIRLDDMSLILLGAIPAAVLALLAQGLFELAERRLVPRGIRLGRSDK